MIVLFLGGNVLGKKGALWSYYSGINGTIGWRVAVRDECAFSISICATFERCRVCMVCFVRHQYNPAKDDFDRKE